MVSPAKENNISKLSPKRTVIVKFCKNVSLLEKKSAKVLKFYHSSRQLKIQQF